ncbi:glycosyltransferase family 4 protein [Tenacibaculum agarivorans]|uniref:glycosyltransferase family 4 protein n=1 Tax=Tenacibaculum agarivorans TaxID=1908389 RepID=UPI00094BBCC9|nr:glycosyltransferase family 4 protein [Tenacibaculum agarivorans]
MKIVELIPKLDIGGAETFISSLSEELAHKAELYIISFEEPSEEFISNFDFKDIKLISLDKKQGIDIKLMYNLYKVLSKIKPDIVHTHLHCVDYILLSSLLLRKTKFFHTIHNLAEKDQENKISRLIRTPFFFLKRIKAICVSETVEKSFKKTYHSDYSTTILNGIKSPKKEEERKADVEISDFFGKKHRIDSYQDIFINVARVTYQKNQLNLIEAFKSHPNSLCLIIGPLDESYLTLDQLKTLPDNVIFIGPTNKVIDFMGYADFLILPSFYEGLPITLLEAMSLEVIPCCTNVGGIKEVIKDEYNGFIIKGTDVNEISRAIDLVEQASSEDRDLISKRTRKTFENHFSIEVCAGEHLKVFSK